MTNILIISHYGFASGAKKAAELIVGEQKNLYCRELNAEQGIDCFKQQVTDLISELTQKNNQLIVLADLKSGTPYNCALSAISQMDLWSKARLFSGMNLNMLLEMLMLDDEMSSEDVLEEILEISKQGISQINKEHWERSNNADEE